MIAQKAISLGRPVAFCLLEHCNLKQNPGHTEKKFCYTNRTWKILKKRVAKIKITMGVDKVAKRILRQEEIGKMRKQK